MLHPWTRPRSDRLVGHNPLFYTLSPKTLHTTHRIICDLNCCNVGLQKKAIGFLVNRCLKTTPECNVSVWINCLGTTLSLVILAALIAHHTPTVSLCDGISWINMGNLLFWEFTVPGFKTKFNYKADDFVMCFCAMRPGRYQFAKLSNSSPCVFYNLWSTVNRM